MTNIEQWEHDVALRETCDHSIFGSCIIPCVKCGVYGFYGPYQDHDRRYWLCKWCGYGKNVDGKEYKCVYEICRKCFPDVSKETFGKNVSLSSEVGRRFTEYPGHPCPKCKTKMEVFKADFNPMQEFKDEIYEIHQYD